MKQKQKEAIESSDPDKIVELQDQIDRKKMELAFKAGREGQPLESEEPEEPVTVFKRKNPDGTDRVVGYGRPSSPKEGQTLTVGDLTEKKEKAEGGENV